MEAEYLMMKINRFFRRYVAGCVVALALFFAFPSITSQNKELGSSCDSQWRTSYIGKGTDILVANLFMAISDVVENVTAGKPFEQEFFALRKMVEIISSSFYHVELWGVRKFFIWVDKQLGQIDKALKNKQRSPKKAVLPTLTRICSAAGIFGMALQKITPFDVWDKEKVEKDLEPLVVPYVTDLGESMLEPVGPPKKPDSSLGRKVLNWFASFAYVDALPTLKCSKYPLVDELIEELESKASKEFKKEDCPTSGLDRRTLKPKDICVKEVKKVFDGFKDKLFEGDIKKFGEKIKECREFIDFVREMAPSTWCGSILALRLQACEDAYKQVVTVAHFNFFDELLQGLSDKDDVDFGVLADEIWKNRKELVYQQRLRQAFKEKCEKTLPGLEKEIRELATYVCSLANEIKKQTCFDEHKQEVLDVVISGALDIHHNIDHEFNSFGEELASLLNQTKKVTKSVVQKTVPLLNVGKDVLSSQAGSVLLGAGALGAAATLVPVSLGAAPFILGGTLAFFFKNADFRLLNECKEALKEQKKSYERMGKVIISLAEKHPVIFDYFLNMIKNSESRKKIRFVRAAWDISSAFVKLAQDMNLGSVASIFDPAAQELLNQLAVDCKDKATILAAFEAFSNNWFASLFLKRMASFFLGERESSWELTLRDVEKAKEAQKIFDFSHSDTEVINALESLFGKEQLLSKYLCLYMYRELGVLVEQQFSGKLISYFKKLEDAIEKRKVFDGDPFDDSIKTSQGDLFSKYVSNPFRQVKDLFWGTRLIQRKRAFDTRVDCFKEKKFFKIPKAHRIGFIVRQIPDFFEYFFSPHYVPKSLLNERVRSLVKKGVGVVGLCSDLKISFIDLVTKVALWWQLPPSYAWWGSAPEGDAQMWEDWYLFLGQSDDKEKVSLCKQFGNAVEGQLKKLVQSPRIGDTFLTVLAGGKVEESQEDKYWGDMEKPYEFMKAQLLDGHDVNDKEWHNLVDKILQGFPASNQELLKEVEQLCEDAEIKLSEEQKKAVKGRILTLLLREKIQQMASELEQYKVQELMQAQAELEDFEKKDATLTQLPLTLNKTLNDALRRKQSLESQMHDGGGVARHWKRDLWLLLSIYNWPLFWPRIIELLNWRSAYLRNEMNIIDAMKKWEPLEETVVPPALTVQKYLNKLVSNDRRLKSTFFSSMTSLDPLLVTSWFTRFWALYTNPFYAKRSVLAAGLVWGVHYIPEILKDLFWTTLFGSPSVLAEQRKSRQDLRVKNLESRAERVVLGGLVEELRKSRQKASLLRKRLDTSAGPSVILKKENYKTQIPSLIMNRK